MKLLKNLVLVDDSHPLNLHKVDILIEKDTIIGIKEEIDLKNIEIIKYNHEYVSPGWIDIHTHIYEGVTDISVDADRIGVDSGVVLLCDAGSSGEATIDDFYNLTKNKKTIVKSWINIASTGLRDRHELKDKSNVNIEKTINKINEYNDFVIGIKVRASASVMGEDTVTPFEKAKIVKEKTGKPIMVHVGNFPPRLEEVLSHLSKGDILTHCYHGKPGGILDENKKVKAYVKNKRLEEVKFDVGHGQESFSYLVSLLAKQDGFYPDSISSDLHKYNLNGPVYSLANVVNKFLNSGYDLNEVISLVTNKPARLLKLQEFGKIKAGGKAHLTIFKLDNEEKELEDSVGMKINVDSVVKVVDVYVNGERCDVKYEN